MFCLIKAPFMFSWNKALIKWIAHSLHWWAAKAQVLAAATPVRSQFRYDSLSHLRKNSLPGPFFEHTTACNLVCCGEHNPRCWIWGFLPFPCALGAPLQQAPTFCSFWSFRGSVKCCGNEAVSDLSLLTPLAVAFTGKKEMPLNSDVFNCCINNILILSWNPPFCWESYILQALYPFTCPLAMTQISHSLYFFLQPPDIFASDPRIS